MPSGYVERVHDMRHRRVGTVRTRSRIRSVTFAPRVDEHNTLVTDEDRRVAVVPTGNDKQAVAELLDRERWRRDR